MNKDLDTNVEKKNTPNQFVLYKSLRILVYLILLTAITTINISSGLFPSASITMKSELKKSETVFDCFAF